MHPLKLRTLTVLILGLSVFALAASSASQPVPVDGRAHFRLTAPLRQALASRPRLWGPSLRASDLRERVVIVTFFASWCVPCRVEMKELNALYPRYRDAGLEIVAVNYFEQFDGYSDPGKLAAFLRRMAPPYAVVMGSEGLSQAFGGITRIPTLLVFDRQGRRAFRFRNTGPDNAVLGGERLRRIITALL